MSAINRSIIYINFIVILFFGVLYSFSFVESKSKSEIEKREEVNTESNKPKVIEESNEEKLNQYGYLNIPKKIIKNKKGETIEIFLNEKVYVLNRKNRLLTIKLDNEIYKFRDKEISFNKPKKEKSTILDVPYISQRPELPSGCEATSLTMALQFFNINVEKETIAKEHIFDNTDLVRNEDWSIKIWGNPDKGYVGDPFSTGYTINPNVLEEQADRYIESTDISGANLNNIENFISEGYPVLAWITINYESPKERFWHTPDGKRIDGKTPLHNVVITGYDQEYIYVNDPENTGGKNIKIDKKKFEEIYNQMGKRALVIGL